MAKKTKKKQTTKKRRKGYGEFSAGRSPLDRKLMELEKISDDAVKQLFMTNKDWFFYFTQPPDGFDILDSSFEFDNWLPPVKVHLLNMYKFVMRFRRRIVRLDYYLFRVPKPKRKRKNTDYKNFAHLYIEIMEKYIGLLSSIMGMGALDDGLIVGFLKILSALAISERSTPDQKIWARDEIKNIFKDYFIPKLTGKIKWKKAKPKPKPIDVVLLSEYERQKELITRIRRETKKNERKVLREIRSHYPKLSEDHEWIARLICGRDTPSDAAYDVLAQIFDRRPDTIRGWIPKAQTREMVRKHIIDGIFSKIPEFSRKNPDNPPS